MKVRMNGSEKEKVSRSEIGKGGMTKRGDRE